MFNKSVDAISLKKKKKYSFAQINSTRSKYYFHHFLFLAIINSFVLPSFSKHIFPEATDLQFQTRTLLWFIKFHVSFPIFLFSLPRDGSRYRETRFSLRNRGRRKLNSLENSAHSFPLPTNPVKIASREATALKEGLDSYEDEKGAGNGDYFARPERDARCGSRGKQKPRQRCRGMSISRESVTRTRRGKLGNFIQILSRQCLQKYHR